MVWDGCGMDEDKHELGENAELGITHYRVCYQLGFGQKYQVLGTKKKTEKCIVHIASLHVCEFRNNLE